MGVKPRKRRAGGRVKAEVITKDGDRTSLVHEPVEYPQDGRPHSEVAVGLGVCRSNRRTYSSATLEVSVTLPCVPGEEAQAADVALAKVTAVLQKYEDDFKDTVDAL